MAVNDRRKQNGEWAETAYFIDIFLWGRRVEVANDYLRKSSRVLIEGRLQQQSWLQNDELRSKLIIVVGDQFKMLDRRSKDTEEGEPQEPARTSSEEVHIQSRITALRGGLSFFSA